jgi:hypothetical protein
LAEKNTQIILDALGRALAEPAGVPLLGSKKAPGLFPSSAAARLVATRCKDEGYLRVLTGSAEKKDELCAITEKGLAFLLEQESPRRVLEDLVRTLESRHAQVGELVKTAETWQSGLDALRETIERILGHLQKPGTSAGPALSSNGSDMWLADLVAHLAGWRAAGHSSDCPLPELFERARRLDTHLTIGHFHDGLRRLHEQGRIYLHPWTGPLYDIPEPKYALMIGHEIDYYASIR